MSGGIRSNIAAPGLISMMGSQDGQGAGILGNIGNALSDHGDGLMGLGLGLMSGDMNSAMQGYAAGNRSDTLRRDLKLKRDQEEQKKAAAQGYAEKMGLDPRMAVANPEGVMALWQAQEQKRLTPKEPRAPQIFGSAEGGYYTLGDDRKAVPLVPGAGAKPAAPPAGYTWKPDGSGLDAIPGGPADKPTEGQSNAGLYAQRMIDSDAILSDPAVSAASQDRWQRTLGNVPVFGNSLVSNEAQSADQAQRNFINATLRRESGAVISPDEFENAKKQYFPQPGDGEEVLKNKAANRRTAIDGIRAAAGPAGKNIREPAPREAPKAADAVKAPPPGVYDYDPNTRSMVPRR